MQLIFQLAVEGVNATAITRELFRRNIPTPGQYKAARGNHTHDISRCHGIWSTSTILRILEDEHYLMGEIDLNTYKAEKVACDELLLKSKNAYAAVLAQAKQKQDEQARQDSRKEASKAIFDADTLTTELAELLIDRVLVYPDRRIEIAYKIKDIFDYAKADMPGSFHAGSGISVLLR